MTAHSANVRWAARTKRRSLQVWIPIDALEDLDAQAQARTVVDPVSGKTRRVGRAEVITALVQEGRSLWGEVVEMANATCDDYRDRLRQTEADLDDSRAELEDLSTKLTKVERHNDRLQSELDELRPRAAELDAETSQLAGEIERLEAHLKVFDPSYRTATDEMTEALAIAERYPL